MVFFLPRSQQYYTGELPKSYMTAKQLFSKLQQGLPNTLLIMSVIGVAGLASGLIVARILGPEGRGEFATIVLWPSTLATFCDLGLGFSFSYLAGKNRDSIHGIWTLAWVFSLLIGGIVSLVAMVILPSVVVLSDIALMGLRWNLATIPFMLLAGYLNYILLGAGYIVEFNFVRVCLSICNILFVTFLVAADRASIISFTVALILAQLASSLLAILLSVSCLHPTWHWRPDLMRPVFRYGIKVYISSLMGQANLRLDQLVMSVTVSPTQLGLYAVSVAISGMVSPLYSAVAIVVLPRVTQASSRLLGGKTALRYLWLIFIGGVPVTFILWFMMPLLLPLLFGDTYTPSILTAQILVIAAFFQGCMLMLGNSLRGLGSPGKEAISQGIGLLVTFGLLFLLLPVWGIMGAAIASLVAYCVVVLIQIVFLFSVAGLVWSDIWSSKEFLYSRNL